MTAYLASFRHNKYLITLLIAITSCFPYISSATDNPADSASDPLKLSDSVQIVTRTEIKAKDVNNNDTDINIPAGTRLYFSSYDGTSSPKTYNLYTTDHPSDCHGLPDSWSGLCKGSDAVKNKSLRFSPPATNDFTDLQNKIIVRRWTTGILIVPYKYGIANHSLASGSMTLGPYLGYSTDFGSGESTFVLSAGITSVPITTVQNGVATSTNKQGLSVATGMLFKPTGRAGTITMGFLLGVDQLGQNSGYSENGKLWLGFYVGAGLGD